MLHFIQEENIFTAIAGFLLFTFLSFVPFVPMPVIAGTIGMTFNFGTALLISWGGSSFGAFLMFLGSRYVFQQRALPYINKHQKVQTLFDLICHNAFFTVFTLRLIPVFPSVLVNLVCSLSKMTWRTFLSGTMIGKLPSMAIYTLAGNKFEEYTWMTIALLTVYFFLIVLLSNLIRTQIDK